MENLKFSWEYCFKKNFDKISTLKILKSIFMKFSFCTQFQVINIFYLENVFKEIYFYQITKPLGNNL